MQALLITGHYLNSKRKAGFHNLADALCRAGWKVIFFTSGLSWLSVLRRDYRLAYPVRREANRLMWVRDNLGSYLWFSRWHPANLRSSLLNRLSYRKFAGYGDLLPPDAQQLVRESDLIIFESTPGLVLFEQCKKLNSSARYVYRVSDDIRLLRNHPVVLDTEERFAPQFDLVSSPCEYIHRRFAHLPKAALHHHGLSKDLYDADSANPYSQEWKTNLVFIGNVHFDHDFLDHASRSFPDWAFHIIGPIPALPKRKNIIAYGEIPFEQTVPYLKHADVGLQNVTYIPGAESWTDSLKVIQYTYCRLPIVVPEFLRSLRSNVYYYQPGKGDSIRRALNEAVQCDRATINTHDIYSWDELVQRLI